MTPLEIAELFIRGAEVDRRLPQTAKPKQLKAQSLGYVHSWAEMREWGDERHKEHRAEMFAKTKLTTQDVSEWERCMELIKHCPDESRRRCLWNWAMAQVGGRPFGRWCREQGFHVETGRRRKNRAILEIFAGFHRNNAQNIQKGIFDVLHVAPENGHIQVTIGDRADSGKVLTWRDDFSLTHGETEPDFSWAEARNERRRQKYAERRKAA